jgi:site-specific DNA-methyltransferase (adenine-specific)
VIILPGAKFIPATANSKLVRVVMVPTRTARSRPVPVGASIATTFVSMALTCPATCRWLIAGTCAGEANYRRFGNLDDDAKDLTGHEVIANEAALLILNAFGGGPIPQDGPGGTGRPLRIHVLGDVHCAGCARMLAAAAEDWVRRGGGKVWTYTHRWREIPREAWGPIEIHASIDSINDVYSIDDIDAAVAAGYTPSIVRREFPLGDAAFQDGGFTFVPCPAQTRERTCADCRLCWDTAALARRRTGIAFREHGQHVRDDERKHALPMVPANVSSPKTRDVEVRHQDALTLLRTLPSRSVPLIVTDPPWGISYKSNHRVDGPTEPIANDDRPFEWRPFLAEVERVLIDGGAAYIFSRWDVYPRAIPEIAKTGLTLKRSIVWVKDTWSAGDLRGDYGSQREEILFITRGRHRLRGPRRPDVWQVPRVPPSRRVHPVEKPIELLTIAIEKSSDPDDLVVDPYAGSGATGVAAVLAGRRALLGEIDPNLVSRIRERLEDVMHGRRAG